MTERRQSKLAAAATAGLAVVRVLEQRVHEASTLRRIGRALMARAARRSDFARGWVRLRMMRML